MIGAETNFDLLLEILTGSTNPSGDMNTTPLNDRRLEEKTFTSLLFISCAQHINQDSEYVKD